MGERFGPIQNMGSRFLPIKNMGSRFLPIQNMGLRFLPIKNMGISYARAHKLTKSGDILVLQIWASHMLVPIS